MKTHPQQAQILGQIASLQDIPHPHIAWINITWRCSAPRPTKITQNNARKSKSAVSAVSFMVIWISWPSLSASTAGFGTTPKGSLHETFNKGIHPVNTYFGKSESGQSRVQPARLECSKAGLRTTRLPSPLQGQTLRHYTFPSLALPSCHSPMKH